MASETALQESNIKTIRVLQQDLTTLTPNMKIDKRDSMKPGSKRPAGADWLDTPVRAKRQKIEYASPYHREFAELEKETADSLLSKAQSTITALSSMVTLARSNHVKELNSRLKSQQISFDAVREEWEKKKKAELKTKISEIQTESKKELEEEKIKSKEKLVENIKLQEKNKELEESLRRLRDELKDEEEKSKENLVEKIKSQEKNKVFIKEAEKLQQQIAVQKSEKSSVEKELHDLKDAYNTLSTEYDEFQNNLVEQLQQTKKSRGRRQTLPR